MDWRVRTVFSEKILLNNSLDRLWFIFKREIQSNWGLIYMCAASESDLRNSINTIDDNAYMYITNNKYYIIFLKIANFGFPIIT